MPIAVVCPSCDARMNAPDAAAGKSVKCPKCKAPMVIPEVNVEDEELPAPPPKKRQPVPDEDDRPRSKKRPVEDDNEEEEDERPRKKYKSKSEQSGMPVGLLIGGGLAAMLLLGGLAFGVYWFAARENPQAASTAPVKGGNSSGGNAGGIGSGKAAVPAGWKVIAPPKAGFKAFFPDVQEIVAKQSPVIPRPGSKTATIANYFGSDRGSKAAVFVFIFPDAMTAAEREKAINDRLVVGIPPQFLKETSRGKSTLGGKDATEVVDEVDFAGLMGGKGPPGGQKLPDKIVAVTRYIITGNRGYAASLEKSDSRPTEAEERGFFDNFELISDSDTPIIDNPKTPDTTPKPPDKSLKLPLSPDEIPPSDRPNLRSPYTAAGRFQIWFPGQSTHNKTKNELMWARKQLGSFADYFDADTSVGYHLGSCDYPNGSSDDFKKALYDEVVGSLSGEGLGSELVSRRKVTMAGKEWDEVITKSGTVHRVTRSLDTGKSVFVFSVSCKTGLPPADAQKAYFDSFNFQK